MTIRALEDYDDHVPTVAAAEQTASSRRRILIAGTIGTAIEWYDFFIYGLIAPLVFDQLASRAPSLALCPSARARTRPIMPACDALPRQATIWSGRIKARSAA